MTTDKYAEAGFIAYVLVNIKAGREHKVYEEVRKLRVIKEAHLALGEYNLIAKIKIPKNKEIDTAEEKINVLNSLVEDEIEPLDGVKYTKMIYTKSTE